METYRVQATREHQKKSQVLSKEYQEHASRLKIIEELKRQNKAIRADNIQLKVDIAGMATTIDDCSKPKASVSRDSHGEGVPWFVDYHPPFWADWIGYRPWLTLLDWRKMDGNLPFLH